MGSPASEGFRKAGEDGKEEEEEAVGEGGRVGCMSDQRGDKVQLQVLITIDAR